MTVENIINKIKEIMSDRRLKQKDVANASGFTEATISHWLNGERVPGLDNALKLLEAVGYEVEIRKKETAIQGWRAPDDVDDEEETQGCIICVSGKERNITYKHAIIADDCNEMEEGCWFIKGYWHPNLKVEAWMPLPEGPDWLK